MIERKGIAKTPREHFCKLPRMSWKSLRRRSHSSRQTCRARKETSLAWPWTKPGTGLQPSADLAAMLRNFYVIAFFGVTGLVFACLIALRGAIGG